MTGRIRTFTDTRRKNKENSEVEYTVRRAQEKDIPAVTELLRQVNLVHHEGRPDLFKKATKYTPDELREIFRNDSTPVFVAEKDSRVVGHGFCILQRPENTRMLTDILTLYIDDICVDESERGKNAGRTIYEHIVSYARLLGCYNVTLNVWTCNPGAVKFYESLGLEPYKTGMEKIL